MSLLLGLGINGTNLFVALVCQHVSLPNTRQIIEYHLFSVLLAVDAKVTRLDGHHHCIYLFLVKKNVTFLEMLVLLYCFVIDERFAGEWTHCLALLHDP